MGKNNILEIYTDGGCKLETKHENGDWTGPGSCAYALISNNKVISSAANFDSATTNNRMELQAVIDALRFCTTFTLLQPELLNKSHKIKIYSDSQYVCKGITEWIHNWIKKGWKTSANKPVENQDLWKQLYVVKNFIESDISNGVEFVWVKGHVDNEFNNLVDQLCTDCINENKNNEQI